jgi:cytochrome c-type biogenesis protein CcmE
MKKTHIIGLVLIAICIGVLISVLGKYASYASFSEAQSNPGKQYHVIGVWDRGAGYEYNPQKDPNYFSFKMKDTLGLELPVVLHDNKPPDFEHSEKVVVIGTMEGNTFQASQILMKCPSKYTGAKPTAERETGN